MTASWLVLVLGIAVGGVVAVSVGMYRTRWQSLPGRRAAPVGEAATTRPVPAVEVMTRSVVDRVEPARADEARYSSAADRVAVTPEDEARYSRATDRVEPAREHEARYSSAADRVAAAPNLPGAVVPPSVVPPSAPAAALSAEETAIAAAARVAPTVPVARVGSVAPRTAPAAALSAEETAIASAARVAPTVPVARVGSASSIPAVPPALYPDRGPDTRSSYDVQSVDDLLAAAEAMSRPPAFGRAARRPARSPVPDAAPSEARAARTGDSTDAVDVAVLDSLLSRLDGPRGTLRDAMITTYLDDGATMVGRLVMAALDGSADAVLQIAPGLRSTCATLGAVRLDELLGQMQDAASSDQPLAPLAWAVDAEHSRVTAALSVILEEPTRLS